MVYRGDDEDFGRERIFDDRFKRPRRGIIGGEDEEDGDLNDEIENILARQEEPVPDKISEFNLTPVEMKEILDRDVIGQQNAKKMLANSMCYHIARIKRGRDAPPEDLADSVVKKNVLLVGNTGVGKTYTVKKVSQVVGVPFVKFDATKFSATGYVGKDVEDMVRGLMLAADFDINLAQYGIIYIDEIDKIRGGYCFGKDVSGAEVQRGLLKLMEETEVDIISSADPMAAASAIKAIEKSMKDKGQKADFKPKINTRHILFIMAGAFPGLEDIVKDRIGNDPLGDWREELLPQDFIKFGMEAEFMGRLPVRVCLDDLDEDDLYKILKLSGDSITKQYIRDFDAYGIKVDFTDGALRTFAAKALSENLGARALTGVMEHTLQDFMFYLPSTDVKELIIDEGLVDDPYGTLIEIVSDPLIEGFKNEFLEEHGVQLTINDFGYELIKQLAVQNKEGIRDICKRTVAPYIDLLKLNNQREFTITHEMVNDPQGYLSELVNREA